MGNKAQRLQVPYKKENDTHKIIQEDNLETNISSSVSVGLVGRALRSTSF